MCRKQLLQQYEQCMCFYVHLYPQLFKCLLNFEQIAASQQYRYYKQSKITDYELRWVVEWLCLSLFTTSQHCLYFVMLQHKFDSIFNDFGQQWRAHHY